MVLTQSSLTIPPQTHRHKVLSKPGSWEHSFDHGCWKVLYYTIPISDLGPVIAFPHGSMVPLAAIVCD